MKAVWNDTILAESEDTVVIENNHYFPPDDVNMKFFKDSPTHTTCPWKGEASYYNIVVNGKVNKLTPYGAFIQLNNHIDGLVHIVLTTCSFSIPSSMRGGSLLSGRLSSQMLPFSAARQISGLWVVTIN